jgi:hypothetical protein
MKKIKVISRVNLPVRLPVLSTAVAYLYLDNPRYHIPGWGYGVVITLFSLLWILVIVTKCFEDRVDLRKDTLRDSEEGKQKF